jgi:hypothetical protein
LTGLFDPFDRFDSFNSFNFVHSAFRNPHSAFTMSLDTHPWQEFLNNNAAQAPAYGLLRATGVSIVEPGRVVLTVDQPNAFGCQANCFVNGPVPVAAGQYGYCTRGGPLVALYETSDGTPAFGDSWGPRSGTWKLKKNTGGFFCLGGPTNAGLGLALFVPLPMLTVRGQVSSDVASGSNGTLTVYTGAFGSETSTSQTIANVQNNSSCTIKANKMATAKYVLDNGGWEFVNAFSS